jgi:hypothetical protein
MTENVDDEWERFLTGGSAPEPIIISPKDSQNNDSAPPCGELHISTKTKVLFLNSEIDTHQMFWDLPIVDYWLPREGIIKKQLKITSNTPEEFEAMQNKLKQSTTYCSEMVFKHIDNPGAKRLKFKDDRKLTVGMSKKDIMNCRGKPKKAFMNCFAIIIRFRFAGEFKEVHVKVFNTGKLEIPGVPDDSMLDTVRAKILDNLRPYVGVDDLQYIRDTDDDQDEDVLINSDFRCGYSIDQKACYSILRSEKYGIETSYDSCHYPGIRCKYYYRNDLPADHPDQNGRICETDMGIKMSQLELSKRYTSVSFMIFSTGSCLIVGNCPKRILLHVYDFMKQMLMAEYSRICISNGNVRAKVKKTKQRKRVISVQMNYFSVISQNSSSTAYSDNQSIREENDEEELESVDDDREIDCNLSP